MICCYYDAAARFLANGLPLDWHEYLKTEGARNLRPNGSQKLPLKNWLVQTGSDAQPKSLRAMMMRCKRIGL